jgi:RNA polymerase sigma factor (TIGR02999 family)
MAGVREIFFDFRQMPSPRFAMSDLTEILSRAENGDPVATNELLPLVYQELRQLARSKLAHESPDQSLQATELVHEAYIRLLGSDQAWEGKRHFFAAAAEAMRRILIDRARRKKSVKHGGHYQRVELNEQTLRHPAVDEEMLVVDDLLDRFAEHHPQEAEIAKLHYFAGFSIRDCAKALGIPPSSAHDRWRFARAWLVGEMIDRNSSD